MQDMIFVAGAGLLGGAMNAIAGGGSFVTLPALVAVGVPSLFANATSTVALVPSALATAFAYRHDFQGFDGVKLSTMAVISVIGGALGALLLLHTSQKFFDALFPFLLLFGVLVFAFGRRLGDALRQRVTIHPRALPVAQSVLAVYGGYFGGAVGVMMLAAWSVLTKATINSMQASRHLLNASMNATAAILFIYGGLIFWKEMAALLVSSTVGGYLAGHYGRRLDPARARLFISCLNATIVAIVFWRAYR
ncbi:sulfite exporter TauE/SafE family protein [uncultured Rhodoblastus sp.]|uniref:sulfite exporter TauE/SafE family protein n=1 Tax=uncultured Rhodoblastus sp. TaxID=543037 RepID=UPI0025FEB4D9|nr:sulfite exporter TauE/SafE family protein [uncultured Rhodoblastus sp.]